MLRTLILIVTMALAGCSSSKYFVKQGGSIDEFDRTLAACHNQAYLLPQNQMQNPLPPGVFAPSYQIQSAIVPGTGMVNTTATPFMNPYATIGYGLMVMGDALQNMAIREQFLENCMIANGWKPTTKEEVSITVSTRALVGDNSTVYRGTTTGYLGGHGTIDVISADNHQCVGTFRYTKPGAGTGVLRCDDGDSAAIEFLSVTKTSGYGFGKSKSGQDVRFAYGMDDLSADAYLSGATATK